MNEIKKNMSIDKINAILAKGGDIHFGPGTYNVTATMVLASNSHITCDSGTIFNKKTAAAMIMTKTAAKTTVFNGAHDITWEGGTFVGNTNSTQSDMIVLFHAKNITIERVEMKKCVGLHFIEINGCKNVTIKSCKFLNHVTKKGKEHKEAIQIDFANYDGLLYGTASAGYYDGTHCRDITITDCVFEDCPNGIGTHTVTNEDKYHKGITITENDIIGRGNTAGGVGIKLLNMRDVTISKNVLKNLETGIYVNRMATGHKAHGGTEKLATYKMCQNFRVSGNVFMVGTEIEAK